jgi:hypothetical protein
MKHIIDAAHKSSDAVYRTSRALFSHVWKALRQGASREAVYRTLRTLFTHPELIGWSSLVLALLFLFIRLGLSDDATLDIWFNSDYLYPVNLFTDVLQDGYSLSGWKFTIAPYWIPDLVDVGIFWLLTRNVIMSTLLGGSVNIVLIVGAFRIIGKAVGTRNIHTQDAFLLASGALITLYVALSPRVNYPNLFMLFLPTSHVGSMVCVLYGWGMALWFLHQELAGAKVSAWLMTAYGILCLLAGMSNLLFFAHMLVPVTAAVAILIFFGIMTIRQCWKPLTWGWVAAAIGALLNPILFRVTPVSAQSEVSQDRLLTSLDVFMRGFVANVLSGDVLHLSAIVWSGVCVAYIAWRLRRVVIGGRSSLSRSQITLLTFFLVSVISAIGSVAAIVLGGSAGLSVFKDYIWSTHYLHQVFFLPLFGFPAVLAWALSYLSSDRVGRIVSWAITSGALALVLARLAPSQWPTTPIYAYRPPLVRFMDEVAPAKGLRYGYAGFWEARMITLLSRSGVRAYAVDASMNPLLWISNEEWYRQLQNDGGAPPKVDFVILDDPVWKLSREAAVQKFGEPLSELQTQGTRILIYAKSR